MTTSITVLYVGRAGAAVRIVEIHAAAAAAAVFEAITCTMKVGSLTCDKRWVMKVMRWATKLSQKQYMQMEYGTG